MDHIFHLSIGKRLRPYYRSTTCDFCSPIVNIIYQDIVAINYHKVCTQENIYTYVKKNTFSKDVHVHIYRHLMYTQEQFYIAHLHETCFPWMRRKREYTFTLSCN